MAQQVARCRNIESLHYFINDTSHYPKYRDRDEAKKSMMADFGEYRETFENMGLLDDEDKINENSDYLEWLAYAVYDSDTFSVCPKKHFEEILQLKGFELVMGKANEKVKLNTKEMRLLVRNEKEEKYMKAIENPEEVDKEYVRKLTERWDILNTNIPKERVEVMWVANDPHQFSEHMRIRHLIDGDDRATERLKTTGEVDFAVRIPKSEAYKLNMLKKLCGEGHPLVAVKEEDKETPHGISEELLNEFKKLFRLKFSNEEVNTWGELEQKRLKAMKQQDMFWGCVEIEKERKTKQVDGKRSDKIHTTYSLDEDTINNHLDLIAKKHGADLKDPYKVFEMYGVEPVKYEFREDEEHYESELETD
jgi:RNAse (barnase) inhibitor barstar